MRQSHSIPGALFWPLAAVVLWVCYFAGLTNVGLIGPDEPRYAWVAREMAESGDWVTPRLYGETWFEKPILYYWGAAAAFRVLGMNEFAARLPSALMALLATLALAVLARRLYGTLAAQFVLLMMPTCVGMFSFARAATTDMLFSGSLALSLACATLLMGFPDGKKPARYWLLLFGAALGLAVLAKGPAGIVLSGGGVFFWMLLTRKWREAFRLLRPEAIVAFGAVALPWYVLCARRNPDFVQVFLISHNFERYLTPVFRHEQPFWFFGPIVLLGLLPWTLLVFALPGDALRRIRERAHGTSAGLFLACWALFPILFFSISKSKLPGYILPSIPPLVLLLAGSLGRVIEEEQPGARWMAAAVGIPFVGIMAEAWIQVQRIPDHSLPPWFVQGDRLLWLLAGIGLCGLTITALGLLGSARSSAALASIMFTVLLGLAVFSFLPRLDPRLSARAAAQEAARHEATKGPVKTYKLHRAHQYALQFYLRRVVEEWSSEQGGPAQVCTSVAGLNELMQKGVQFRLEHLLPPSSVQCAEVSSP